MIVFELAFVSVFLTANPMAVDTIVDLSPGDRVVIENLSGEISVRTWDRSQLEVRSLDEDEDAGLRVRRSGSRVTLVGDDRQRGRGVEVEIRVPDWADVEISGLRLDVVVDGVGGTLSMSNVQGDIRVENTTGDVTIRTVQGEIDVVNATGRVTASSQSDDVRLHRVSGTIQVHAGDGDVTLEEIEAPSVRAETQDGDITFSGSLASGGSYGFYVHDGDAHITLPASTGAEVSVSTFDGEFESEFPVLVQRYTGGREFEFTIGDGSARLQIQVFDGEILLLEGRQ